ncbi:unnamed protein product [Rotaria sp. Silwood1]|nr:unnamed protein product [Rotaria sp. Silwood1]CAF3686264.1 unnamed protein product [Rotaria sp. Silwood1]CAF4933349.1 unnamed protein product [Rotaria sp. Silwood1]
MLIYRILRLLTNFSIQQKQYSVQVFSSYRQIQMKNSFKSIHKNNQIQFKLKSINDTHATLIINGKECKYDWIFLRDSCQCHQCIDLSTKQKRHKTTDIPLTISPQQTGLKILNNNILEIHWNQPLLNEKNNSNIHRSLYSSTWLQTYSTSENIARSRYQDRPFIYWNRNDIQKVNLHVKCNDYLYSDQGLYTVLKYLNDYGLVFIDNVQGEFTVEHLVERIGEIRHTFYGKTWDVRNVQQAINVAYTSQELGLHMDLLYFEAPPGLQFLHSLENNVHGGASYYADTFRAAEILRQNDPEAFQILCSYPVTFHYRNADRHYHFTRSTIVLNRFSFDNHIDHINYSPPFQAPFESDTSKSDFRKFIRAFQYFRDLIDDQNNHLELILEKDQCVIFHNRRILHGRREFDPSSGERWFKGCYTDLDNFKDRLRIVREKFEPISELEFIRKQHEGYLFPNTNELYDNDSGIQSTASINVITRSAARAHNNQQDNEVKLTSVYNIRLRATQLQGKTFSSPSYTNMGSTASSLNTNDKSMVPSSSNENVSAEVHLSSMGFSMRKIKEEQLKDMEIQEKKKNLSSNQDFEIVNGILYKLVPRAKRKIKLIWIPKTMINQVLFLHYDHYTAVHMGINKTTTKLVNKRTKLPEKMNIIPTPNEVMDLVGMDYWGPTEQSTTNGNKYVITMTDYLSKFGFAKAVTANSAQEATEVFLDVCYHYGASTKLITDQGPHFIAELTKSIINSYHTTHILATPYHPTSIV